MHYADQLVVSPDAGALSLSNTIKSTSTYLTTIHFSSFFFFYSFRGIVIVQSLRYFYTLDYDHLSFIIINTRPIKDFLRPRRRFLIASSRKKTFSFVERRASFFGTIFFAASKGERKNRGETDREKMKVHGGKELVTMRTESPIHVRASSFPLGFVFARAHHQNESCLHLWVGARIRILRRHACIFTYTPGLVYQCQSYCTFVCTCTSFSHT